MIFRNNNKVFPYKISLKLDQYLLVLFNLCYDVSIQLVPLGEDEYEVEYASKLFNSSLYDELEINIDDFLVREEGGRCQSTKEELFTDLASNLNIFYLKSDIFSSKLQQKEFLYYFKDTFVVYSTIDNGKDFSTKINNAFKSIDVISEIIKHFNNEGLKEAIKGISAIYDFNKVYTQFINVHKPELVKPMLLKICIDLFKPESIDLELFDYDNIWINYSNTLLQDLTHDSEIDEYYLVKDKESRRVIGIKVNEFILLKHSNEDISNYIGKDKHNQFIWELLKESILKPKESGLPSATGLIEQFNRISITDPEFNKLLCNIKYNLYIDRKIVINANYSQFFEEFVMIKDLDELNDFNFFVPDESSEKESLGIYTDKKVGKKYNLLHYLKHQDQKYFHGYTNSKPQRTEKVKVNILKAELSFYFVEKYYEDVIEQLLKESDVEFITNVELYIKGDPNSKAEFDFILFKNNKFYFLEAKTTISKDNVYETLNKYDKNIELLKQLQNVDILDFRFILMGLLSNENLNNYEYFFVNQDYNKKRKDFAITPYKFEVPFFRHQGLKLECIAEPEVVKLQEFIKEICQK